MSLTPVKRLRKTPPPAKKPAGVDPFPDDIHFDNAGMANDGRRIRLTAPFPCWTSHGLITVPEGFVCDGASIPPAAQGIIGHPFDAHLEAGVLHDYLYSRGSSKHKITRKEADELFRECLWNSGVAKWKIPLMFAAVRLFGGQFYKAR